MVRFPALLISGTLSKIVRFLFISKEILKAEISKILYHMYDIYMDFVELRARQSFVEL